MTVRKGVGQGFGFGIGCLLLGVAIVVGLIALGSTAQKNGSIAPFVVPPAATVAPAAPPRAAAVLLSRPGTGTQRTARFTATGDWTIAYTYDCAKFGQAGILQIYVYTADGQFADVAANALGTTGEGSQPEYKAGTFYLEVNSVCDWTVEVKG